MENALLIGLSRQIALERQMDVVANNVANVNTNGFKADRSLFEEFLMLGRARRQFRRPRPPRQLRAGPRHLARFRARRAEQTKNPLDVAIDGNGFLVVQTAARRALHPRRRAADQRARASSSPPPASGARRRGPIMFQPTDQDITIAADGTVTVLEGTSRTRLDPRQAAAGQLRRSRSSCVKDGSNLYSRRRRRRAAARHRRRRCARASIEKSNVNAVAEMSAHDRGDARLHADRRACCSSRATCARSAIEKLADVPA